VVGARLRAALEVGRDPSLRRFWFSQMVSEVGDWVGLLGVAALLYQVTDKAIYAAASVTALYLPYLLSPWLTALCAKLPPRQLLIGADLLRSAIIPLLLIDGLPPWLLLLVVFVSALPTPVYEATRSAVVPEYAPDETTLDDALVLFQSTQQAANTLGFLLGGLVLATVHVEAALWLNAVSYMLSAMLLMGIPSMPPIASVTTSAGTLVADGLRALRRQPLLRRTVALAVVSASTIMAGEALVVVYAGDIGHSGMSGVFAAATTSVAAVAALVMPRHYASATLLRIAATTLGLGSALALLLFSAAPGVFVGLAGYIALGVISAPGALTYVVAVREMSLQVRASVFSMVQVLLMGGQALVALLAGRLADQIGVGLAIGVLQLPTLFLALAAIVLTPKVRPVLSDLKASPA